MAFPARKDYKNNANKFFTPFPHSHASLWLRQRGSCKEPIVWRNAKRTLFDKFGLHSEAQFPCGWFAEGEGGSWKAAGSQIRSKDIFFKDVYRFFVFNDSFINKHHKSLSSYFHILLIRLGVHVLKNYSIVLKKIKK